MASVHLVLLMKTQGAEYLRTALSKYLFIPVKELHRFQFVGCQGFVPC
jgi:hypothetical protein